jgi:hypothetical protein
MAGIQGEGWGGVGVRVRVRVRVRVTVTVRWPAVNGVHKLLLDLSPIQGS